MSEPDTTELKMPDPQKVGETVARIAEQSQRLVQDFGRMQSPALGAMFDLLAAAHAGSHDERPISCLAHGR